MLTPADRQNLIAQLEALRSQLMLHPKRLIKELPKELQHRIRSYAIIGPITSSGIEHTEAIIDRIIWATYYLTNPDQAEEEGPILTSDPTTTPAPQADNQTAKPPNHEAQPPPPLPPFDFGPYDPRKTQQ